MKINLQAGRVRLLFVADEIPPELQRIIEFLNGQMDPAVVLGVEVPQFVGGDLQTLVPRLVGLTMEAQVRKASYPSRTRATREQLLSAFEGFCREAVADFLTQCECQGLKVVMGTNGCSIRMMLPDGSKEVSVAWIFPPGVWGLDGAPWDRDRLRTGSPLARRLHVGSLPRLRQCGLAAAGFGNSTGGLRRRCRNPS